MEPKSMVNLLIALNYSTGTINFYIQLNILKKYGESQYLLKATGMYLLLLLLTAFFAFFTFALALKVSIFLFPYSSSLRLDLENR